AKSNSYTVSYAIKVFRPNLNKSTPTQADISSSVNAFHDSITNKTNPTGDPLKNYCLQVSSTVAPLNN
ncbi:hypothetical protein IJJ97_02655, partial [bacterium]|nr:hypothetical protein [bacterium]